jgi:hypothetical protein
MMPDPQPNFSPKLRKLLTNLPLIEEDVRNLYDCEEIFEEIDIRKRSLQFALSIKDTTKALHEASSLEDYYIDLLTE